MKLLAFIFCLSLFVGETEKSMSWNLTEYEFGEIQQNIPVTAHYELTNNSDAPLIINKVKVGCGCTSSNYKKDPISPGETTIIEATFNAKKIGNFNKSVSVFTNLEEEATVLRFKGTVIDS